jgi:murein L,D-transpeptidase YcbB/YkuD
MATVRGLALSAGAGLLGAVLLGTVAVTAHGQTRQSYSSALQLVIHVPAARLDVWQGGVRTGSYSVAVGSPQFPTPIGEFEVSEITWNPWWLPPRSEWARAEKAQPPGPRNPMGRVKLKVGGDYYLHGTSDVSSIGRAASHGCVRLRNSDALELARTLWSAADLELSAALVDSLEADPARTRRAPLSCRVPVTIRYDRAEVLDTVLALYPDIYGRAPDLRSEVLSALIRAGYVEGDLNLPQIERVSGTQRTPRTVPLRELLRSEVWRRVPLNLHPERSKP